MLERIIPFAHQKVLEVLTINDVAIDATCGNGNDTLFMAKICKHVYSFDIQTQALDATKSLLQKHTIDNITLVHNGHENLQEYIMGPVKAVMFNLGYLPNYNKDIVTKPATTISAIKSALTLLANDGIISITLYIGHEGGLVESNHITTFVESLSSNEYDVLLYKFINKKNAPYNIIIQKK